MTTETRRRSVKKYREKLKLDPERLELEKSKARKRTSLAYWSDPALYRSLMAKSRKKRLATDPAKYRAGQRACNIKRYYGLRQDEWNRLFEAQGSRCKCCGTTEHGGKNWHTDHDRACCPGQKSCGQCIRGILCHQCNLMLGNANDDPARLLLAIQYLKQF